MRGDDRRRRGRCCSPSNHISWTDILVIGSRGDVSFIAKSDLAGWPVFGLLARLQRTVFVERERRGNSGEQASEIAGGWPPATPWCSSPRAAPATAI